MLKFNWLREPAGVGLLILFSIFFGILVADPVLHKIVSTPTNTYEACEKGDLRHCKTLPPILDSVVYENGAADGNTESNRNEYRAEKDLRAQRDMAFWAMLMFFATLAGVGLLYATWRETVAVTAETRRIGEAQTSGHLVFNPKYALFGKEAIHLVCEIGAIGNTPITNVRIDRNYYIFGKTGAN